MALSDSELHEKWMAAADDDPPVDADVEDTTAAATTDGEVLTEGVAETATETQEVADVTASADESSSGTEAGESREATAEEIADAIEAMRNGQPYRLPKDLTVPLKRGDQVEFVPIEEALRGAMRQADYTRKTTEVAQHRRAVEEERTKLQVEAARFEARQKALAEQEAAWREARKDPAKLAEYEQHYLAMQNNPVYRQMVEDALRAREVEAENAVYREREEMETNLAIANRVYDAILAAGEQYQGVNPDRVKERLSLGLQAGTMALSVDQIHKLYREEAGYASQVVSPIQKQVEELKAELATLKAQQKAETHNANTAAAMQRAKTPNLAPTGGPPATGRKPRQPFTRDKLDEVHKEWINS